MEPSVDKTQPTTYNQHKNMKMKYVSSDAVKLISKPKHMYPLFNLFELEINRLSTLPEYKILAAQIIDFNCELEEWKRKNVEVRNLFVAYHLYQNLFARMKFTSNLVIDRNQAKRSYVDIAHWFFAEKPKIRNKVPDKEEATMKPSTADTHDQGEINSLLVTNEVKRQLKVYETMSRTSHGEFFPPKERLLEYKRRDLLSGINHLQQPRRSFSTTNITRTQTYKYSFGSTMATSFKNTNTQLLNTKEQKIEPMIAPFELKDNDNKPVEQLSPEIPLTVEELEQQQKQKNINQEQLLQQNLVQVIHEEDNLDLDDEIYEEEQERKPDLNKYKKYKVEHNADQILKAEENIKDIKQSTLRRILKQKEESIRSKMEELNIAKSMANWAAVKGRQNTQFHRRSQRKILANRYTDTKYIPKTFEQKLSSRNREIPQFQMLYRNKSSNTRCIEQQVQKMKINNALRTYGKFINHIQIQPLNMQNQEEREELKIMRATSLTSFSHQGKRDPFSRILRMQGAQKYNNDAEDDMFMIKERLAKKAISIQKQQILQGLNIVNIANINKLTDKDIYPPNKKMFNNPFFPKHLYTTKPKKKKN